MQYWLCSLFHARLKSLDRMDWCLHSWNVRYRGTGLILKTNLLAPILWCQASRDPKLKTFWVSLELKLTILITQFILYMKFTFEWSDTAGARGVNHYNKSSPHWQSMHRTLFLWGKSCRKVYSHEICIIFRTFSLRGMWLRNIRIRLSENRLPKL